MKRLFFIYNLLFFISIGTAQNLVPNHSFEDTLQCVSSDNQFTGYIANWTGQGGGGGLCYFTAQCPDSIPKYSSVGVPSNVLGFQYAHTGVSYAGIYTYISDTTKGDPFDTNLYNSRNYIQVKLINSLNSGEKYYVTFYVCLTNLMNFACNDMGALFSIDSVPMNNITESRVIDSIPQVANDPIKNPLTDTAHWTKIAGSFIAKGGERYLTIGNFKNDTTSNIKYLGSIQAAGAYYYIDDVIVSPDSNYADSLFSGINELRAKNEEVRVWPNPNDGKFSIEITNYELRIKNSVEVYNVLGEKVYSQLLIPNSQFLINLSNQPAGMYLYRVISETGECIGSGKLVIQK
ncbi:MAG: T9SS type A sorting domain-containing protein [Bacteroidia bacterium]